VIRILNLAALLLGLLDRTAGGATQAEQASRGSQETGQDLALRLRTVMPQAPSTNHAMLKIRGTHGRTQVPVVVIARPGSVGWSVEYRVGRAGSEPGLQVWTIHHRLDGAPRYERQQPAPSATKTTATTTTATTATVTEAQGLETLGDGDFALRELGMEFLHWPDQRLRGRELSNGRWCQVLESRSGRPDGPAVVRSWIDENLGVLLSAEVYDGRQRRLKQFSITQFREQGDRWSCSVSMVDDRRGTKTELSFDGPAPR
jgi:hypothetical protein